MTDSNNDKMLGIFRVIVHQVHNVPPTERFRGLPDPYIKIFYHGNFY